MKPAELDQLRTFEWVPVLPGMSAIKIVNNNANQIVALIAWGT